MNAIRYADGTITNSAIALSNPMLSFNDPKWKELQGGYRIPYDVSPLLAQLEQGDDVWETLWEELHHQGDIGEASYAAVPHIVCIKANDSSRDWNFYGLISTIEVARHRKSSPPLPDWLVPDYLQAWKTILRISLHDIEVTKDSFTTQTILGAIALAKGNIKLGALIVGLDESETDDMLEKYYAWSELYVEAVQ